MAEPATMMATPLIGIFLKITYLFIYLLALTTTTCDDAVPPHQGDIVYLFIFLVSFPPRQEGLVFFFLFVLLIT